MGGLRLVLIVVASVVLVQPSAAQQFPAKPITMVVPYAPGGNVDVTARVLQAAIGDALGQPVVIENRPGGAGLIAGDYVARAEPDGHTLLVGSNGPVILGPLTMAKPAYQWQQAFAPVSSLAIATNLLLVRAGLPAASVQELVDYARRNPNKLTLATSSVASTSSTTSWPSCSSSRPASPGPRCTTAAMRSPSTTLSRVTSMSAFSSWSTPLSTSRAASCARSRCRAGSAPPRFPRCRRWRRPDIPRSKG